ncbi:MAG TPA: hypothetical protein VJM14_15365 [Burkholderiales bacterium]|nr:hypothetical protein [Burkholderiales bacterium]
MPVAGEAHTGATALYTQEAAVIEALQRRGFAAAFFTEGDRLRVVGTDRAFPPEEMTIRDYYRFEGTSDPDDMSIVYALEGSDGTRGILVDAFGTYADPAVGAVLDRMRIARVAEGETGKDSRGRCR